MPGEMKSWAEYLAYAHQAEQAGHHELAQVWRAISHVERYEHFYQEAGLKGYRQQDGAQALQTGIELAQRHLNHFKQAAEQASQQGDREAAAFFTRAAGDAQRRTDQFDQARRALEGDGQMPKAQPVQATTIQQRRSSVQDQTKQNLTEAMKMTAFAGGLYWLFARRAVSNAQADLAALFLGAADQELEDHFNQAANLAGLVGGVQDNLRASIKGETTAHRQYSDGAQDAEQGNQQALRFFKDAASDEAHHKHVFQLFLQRISEGSNAA